MDFLEINLIRRIGKKWRKKKSKIAIKPPKKDE